MGKILAKFAHFCQKRTILTQIWSFWPHKNAKKANITNLCDNFFLNIARIIYTKIWTNQAGSYCVQLRFVRSFIFYFLPIRQKKCDYWPQKPGFLAKISKILEINKNHPNTCYVKFLGHLDHFWPFFWHFWPFFGHFWAY